MVFSFCFVVFSSTFLWFSTLAWGFYGFVGAIATFSFALLIMMVIDGTFGGSQWWFLGVFQLSSSFSGMVITRFGLPSWGCSLGYSRGF